MFSKSTGTEDLGYIDRYRTRYTKPNGPCYAYLILYTFQRPHLLLKSVLHFNTVCPSTDCYLIVPSLLSNVFLCSVFPTYMQTLFWTMLDWLIYSTVKNYRICSNITTLTLLQFYFHKCQFSPVGCYPWRKEISVPLLSQKQFCFNMSILYMLNVTGVHFNLAFTFISNLLRSFIAVGTY